jgi:Helix-turn-helix domain
VEVTRRYSNPPCRGADLRRLLTATPVRQPKTPPKQHQRRLRPNELEQLAADYLAGIEARTLAERYGIARQTVFDHVRRKGLRRRYPRLGPGDVDEARHMYLSGMSLATIGDHLGVDPGTVRRALIPIGVATRDPHGRARPN